MLAAGLENIVALRVESCTLNKDFLLLQDGNLQITDRSAACLRPPICLSITMTPASPTGEPLTFLSVDFFEFDTVISPVKGGFEPNYQFTSHVSHTNHSSCWRPP